MDQKEGLSGKHQKQLLEALGRLREDEARRIEKEEASLWAPIEAPLSLADALARLTRAELSNIRANCGLSGASALKKQELADKLTEALPLLLGSVLEMFDDERYKLLKRAAARKDGVVEAEADPYRARYFVQRGVLFPGTLDGKRVLVMPQELANAFNGMDASIARRVRENVTIVKLTRGLLVYYGVLDLFTLWSLLKPHVQENVYPGELLALLNDVLDYAGGGLQSGEFGFADEAVVDPDDVIAAHGIREDLSFRPFRTEELLQAGVDDYVDRTPAYRELVRFLIDTYDITAEQADEYVRESSFEIQNGEGPSAIVEFYQERFEISDAETAGPFVERIMNLMNGTRLWALKGHSPSELSAAQAAPEPQESPGRNAAGNVIDFATGRKVGRNDPCPCGSGKKFKKCCGG